MTVPFSTNKDLPFLEDVLTDFTTEELTDFIRYYHYHTHAYNHRDLLALRKVLLGFPQDQRKDFVSFCRTNVHPEDHEDWVRPENREDWEYDPYYKNISFIDGAILIAILMKSGIVDRHSENIYFCLWNIWFWTNNIDRITELDIDPYATDEPEDIERNVEEMATFDLPRDIVHFRYLKTLTIKDLRSISPEFDFTLLPHLTNLSCMECRGFRAPSQIQIPQLKHFCLECCRSNNPPLFGSNHFTWITRQLPNLESLILSFFTSDQIQPLLDAFIGNNICFRDGLKRIELNFYGIQMKDITNICRLVLPKLVNLEKITINTGEIEILKSLSAATTLSPTIHIVDFCLNFVLSRPLKEEHAVMDALLKFLKTNSGVYNLCESMYPNDLKYMLLINHSGPFIFVDNGRGKKAKNKTSNTTRMSIRPSVFPLVLYRAYEKSDNIYCTSSTMRGTKSCDGVYDLLRRNINEVLIAATGCSNQKRKNPSEIYEHEKSKDAK